MMLDCEDWPLFGPPHLAMLRAGLMPPPPLPGMALNAPAAAYAAAINNAAAVDNNHHHGGGAAAVGGGGLAI